MTLLSEKGFNPDAVGSLISGILFGSAIGAMSFIVQPVFVQGISNGLGFSAEQAGYAASAEMSGFALATILLVFLAGKINWHKAFYFLLSWIVLGNLLSSVIASDFNMFLVTRMMAGIGSGGVVSLSFAMVGMTSNPDRNFGLMVSVAMISGAIVMYLAPGIMEASGLSGLLYLFSALGAVGLFLVRFAPLSLKEEAQDTLEVSQTNWMPILLSVGAMFAFWLAQGGVWAYLGLMGEVKEAGVDDISKALTLSQFSGLAGALLPVIFASRFGRVWPMALALLAGVLPLLIFIYGTGGVQEFLIIALIYNFGFNLGHPYLLAIMANLDATGRVVIYSVAAQTIGMAVGPAVTANVLSEFGYNGIAWFGIFFFIATFMMILASTTNFTKNGKIQST